MLKEFLPAEKAMMELEFRSYRSPFNWKRAYDLILLATGDKGLAEEAALKAQQEEIIRKTSGPIK